MCGLEILASQYGGGGGGGGERLNDKETEMGGLGSQWSKFLHSLIKKGYFMVCAHVHVHAYMCIYVQCYRLKLKAHSYTSS